MQKKLTSEENMNIKINDRAYKLFFIASNYDKILDERQKAFLKLVTSNESTNDFSARIIKLVESAKLNTQWRRQFMYFQDYMNESFDQGKKEKAIEDTIELLKEDISPEIISKCVKLPLEKVLELQEQIKVQA